MSQYSLVRFDTGSITALGRIALGLVLVTGVLHVYAGVVEGRLPVALAGVGFLVAAVLYLAAYRRQLLYLVGVLYTAVQIPVWYVAKAGEYTTVGYVDKAVQVVLVVVLLALYWRTRTTADDRSDAAGTEPTG